MASSHNVKSLCLEFEFLDTSHLKTETSDCINSDAVTRLISSNQYNLLKDANLVKETSIIYFQTATDYNMPLNP